ncbi:F/Y-rich domain-containing protein [Encephalitozoon cuniculi]|nr:F/Y-rich domain-containing protein [Encephalitozoon cuniculi]
MRKALESVMEEEDELARRFMNAYNKRVELYRQRRMLEDAIDTKLSDQRTLREAIDMSRGMSGREKSKQPDHGTMFGTGIYRLSLVDMGKLPTENLDMLHTETAIYPVGYTCRKKYKRHDTYKKKAKDRILYICSVDPQKGPVITADDGRKWFGPNMWEDFVNSVGGVAEYKSTEEFFGFGNPALARRVESLGDLSTFKKYVPLSKRS